MDWIEDQRDSSKNSRQNTLERSVTSCGRPFFKGWHVTLYYIKHLKIVDISKTNPFIVTSSRI